MSVDKRAVVDRIAPVLASFLMLDDHDRVLGSDLVTDYIGCCCQALEGGEVFADAVMECMHIGNPTVVKALMLAAVSKKQPVGPDEICSSSSPPPHLPPNRHPGQLN